MKKAGEIGEYLKSLFNKLKSEFPTLVQDVRGIGCMLGIELAKDGQPAVDRLQEMGYLVNCTHVTVLRFLPPFIVTRAQCDEIVEALRRVFTEY
jgi:acetylornithine/succinyldiaminopimelate/putrescine aminotransferase